MGTFLAGIGITLVLFIALFFGVVAFAGIIATVRVALKEPMGTTAKVLWIFACLFIPGAALLYFAFVDKNLFLRITGWVCLLFIAGLCLLGGAALWGGAEGVKREWRHDLGDKLREWDLDSEDKTPGFEKAPEKDESPDDSTLSL